MSTSSYDNLLAIDTATAVLRLAVSFGEDRMIKSEEPNEFSHASVIMKKISDLLAMAELRADSLHGLVVNIGPGSFTGLRIGLSAAKGIAVVNDTAISGISMFDLATAQLADIGEPVNVVVPFKRDQVYVGVVEDGHCDVESIRPVALVDLAEHLGATPSTAVGLDLRNLAPSARTPSIGGKIGYTAADLLALGRTRLKHGAADDLASLEPLYLQKSQAEIRFEQRQQGRA